MEPICWWMQVRLIQLFYHFATVMQYTFEAFISVWTYSSASTGTHILRVLKGEPRASVWAWRGIWSFSSKQKWWNIPDGWENLCNSVSPLKPFLKKQGVNNNNNSTSNKQKTTYGLGRKFRNEKESVRHWRLCIVFGFEGGSSSSRVK